MRKSYIWAVLLGVSGMLLLTGATNRQKSFVPPSLQQCREACGDLSELDETLRKAFAKESDFEPIGRPGPDDWLAQHEESGQTFVQYQKSGANQPDEQRRTIYLLPLGRFPDQKTFLNNLREFGELYFAMPVRLLEPLNIQQARITTRINPHTRKRQLLTGDILTLLQKTLPRDAYCLLAVTMDDLYPEESWNYVFGSATYRARVGVFSFCPLRSRFFW